MTARLNPQPTPTGRAPDDEHDYSTSPPPVRGLSEPKGVRGGIAAAKPSSIGATTTTATTTSPGPRSASSSSPPASDPAATEFPLFGQLPPEVRLQVWRIALPPRTVELHSGRYSSHYARSAPALWHSSSDNPAPLAACAEARQEGLRRYYTVVLPVAAPAGGEGGSDLGRARRPHDDDDDDNYDPCAVRRPGGPAANPERRLYLDPRRDTLVILGALEYRRLEALGADVARQDARGLRRLGLTTGGFTRGSAGPELRVWARVGSLLAGLDQFTLLLHRERGPPADLGRGGSVAIVPCDPRDPRYAAFATSHRHHLGSGSGWIVVGAQNRRMHVAHLEFVRANGVPVD